MFKKYQVEIICGFLILLFLSPLLIDINSTRFLIHDNLDGLVPLYAFMGNKEVYFASSDSMINGIMDQMPRSFLPSPFSFFRFLFLFFSPKVAYAIHYSWMHVIAFIGMRLLIKNSLRISDSVVYNFVSLAFSFLPFWPGGELTVAGLPLLVWASIEIFTQNSNYKNWMIVSFFPFFSSLPFGNMFSFPILFLFYVLGFILFKKWQFKPLHLMVFFLLGLSTIISEWEMFKLIFSGVQSNRVESIGEPMNMNIKGVIGVSILAFLFGHYHFHSFQILIVGVSIIILLWTLFKKQKQSYLNIFMVLSIIYCLYFITILMNNVVLLKNFKFSVRFWVLFPTLWYVLFAYVLVFIQSKFIRKIVIGAQVFWVMFLIYPKDYYGSVYAESPFYYSTINRNSDDQETFESYYHTIELSDIKNRHPELKNSNVMCIGFSPAIAWYNKLNTFDAYLNLYPLSKWHTIKKINLDEYQKANVNYYSNNRAYLFSSELELSADTLNPKWNLDGFKEANVSYILSTKPILGAYKFLDQTKTFYLYQILN